MDPGHGPPDAVARRALGSFLRSVRERQNLTQTRLAELSEAGSWRVSRGAVSSIERGENFPSFKGLVAYAETLHLDPREVLEQARREVSTPADLTDVSLQDLELRARDLVLSGDYRRAIAHYDAMLERLVLDPPPDPQVRKRLQAEIEIKRSAALRRCGAALSAEDAAKRAITLSEGYPEIRLEAYRLLGVVELQMGWLPLASDATARAVELADACGDKEKARAWTDRGLVLLAMNRFEEARQAFLEARELFRQTRDENNWAYIGGNIGLCWAGAGDRGQARKWLKRALDLARKNGLAILEARWLIELGRLRLDDGDLDGADRLAVQGLIIGRQRDHDLTVFRAVWLRHCVARRRSPQAADRRRRVVLARLAQRLVAHAAEREIREFHQSVRNEGKRTGAQQSHSVPCGWQ